MKQHGDMAGAYVISPEEWRGSVLARVDSICRLLRKLEAKPDKTVHEVRKELKKVRAAIRLARRSLGSKRSRRVNRDLRDVGRVLSGFRDAYVRQVLVTELRDHSSVEQGRAAMDLAVAHQAAVYQEEVTEHALRKAGEVISPILESVRRRIRAWRIEGDGWETGLREEWVASHHLAREAMRRCLIHPTETNFHDWRKVCKTLRHQMEFVAGLPEFDGRMDEVELRQLLDKLGGINDLAVLGAAMEHLAISDLSAAELGMIRSELAGRHHMLEEECRVLGGRIFVREVGCESRSL